MADIQEMLASKEVKLIFLHSRTSQVNLWKWTTGNKKDCISKNPHWKSHGKNKNFHILDFVPITLCRNGIIDMTSFLCVQCYQLSPTISGWSVMTMIFLIVYDFPHCFCWACRRLEYSSLALRGCNANYVQTMPDNYFEILYQLKCSVSLDY